jgi:uncharacterized protein YjiS (DUF1127 family)
VAGGPRAPAPSARIAGLIRKRWRAYWDRRARKVTIMLLHSLDRRTLHDIGISPSEIESLCLDSCDDRRPRYDAGWMWRRGRS